MTAPAGLCEWCGGPQNWTIISGVMYVKCIAGCLPLELTELVPPPDSEWYEGGALGEYLEHPKKGEGSPLEGSAARVNDRSLKALEDPPPEFLDSLWEGNRYGTSDEG